MTERLVLNIVGRGGWFPEEFPSGWQCRGRGLDLGVGEAVGQGGHFNDDNP